MIRVNFLIVGSSVSVVCSSFNYVSFTKLIGSIVFEILKL